MTFDSHLTKKLKHKRFKEMYEEEKELLEISIEIIEAITGQNPSQAELAKRAHVTQQQLSRIENGMNFNIKTLLKLCNALNLSIDFKQRPELIDAFDAGKIGSISWDDLKEKLRKQV